MSVTSLSKFSIKHLLGVFHKDPSMICILKGKDHVYDYVNPSYQALVGDREIIGLSVSEVFPELAEMGLTKVLDTVFETGNPFAGSEMPAKKGGKEERIFDFTYQAIVLDDESIYGIYVQIFDVTEKVEARKKLKESEENWRKLANFVPSYIWTANSEGHITFVSDKWFDYTGSLDKRASIEGDWQFVHPEDEIKYKVIWKDAVTKESFFEIELRCRRFDGTYRWFLLQAQPLMDSSGTVISWFGSFNDINERKLEEFERLQIVEKERLVYFSTEIQRQFLKNLFDLIPAIVCTLKGPDHEFELINPAVERLFGNRNVIGYRAIDVFPETSGLEFTEKLDKVYNTGEPYIGIELPYPMFNPQSGIIENYYFTFAIYAMHGENGCINGIFIFAYDVTEQVKNREALALKNELLIKINNDLDNFIYTASHDLRAPVSNIEGLINALKYSLGDDMNKNEEFGDIMKLVSSSIDRFKNTIQELTEISKVQKEVEEEIEYVYFEEVLEEIQLLYQEQIKSTEAKIIVNLNEGLGFRFSRKNFRSIIHNLVSNALKYRQSDIRPEILIKTELMSNYLIFSVKDNGLGIPRNQLDKVFTMFKRFHSHVEGTGVGLYIVKRIIDNAGGKIEVESSEGKGTTFRVFFKL